ncbi:hypothetical protein [Actinophytocola oryzae]|uniref:hypothetical protein n=1 Tax=Actinophytocola oryzae TaxID=502181 RepID=UPI001063FA37|nr:hypothetical protein [Actinophytocola oryzae]
MAASNARDALVVGRGVPAYLLRVTILVVGAAIVSVPLHAGVTVGTLVVLLPAVLASAYAPASPAPAGVVVVAAVLVTLGGGDPLRAEVLVLIPLVHLFHVACGLAGVMPARGRVHVSAVWVAARRFLLVQAAMAVLVCIAALLPTGPTAQVVEAVALVGLAGVAVLVIQLQRVR